MTDKSGTKILIHRTALGYKVVRLDDSAVPDALECLAEGRTPGGTELDPLPTWVNAVFEQMDEEEQPWALLPAPKVLAGELVHSPSESKLTEELRASLTDIATAFLKKGVSSEDSFDPTESLRNGLLKFLDSEEAMSELCSDAIEAVACGIGHAIGNDLAIRMGLAGDFLPDVSSDLGDERHSDSPRLPERYLRPEEFAIVLPAGDNFLKDKAASGVLSEELQRLRKSIFRECGFLVPGMVIRAFEDGQEASAPERVGAFAITRRGITVLSGRFPQPDNRSRTSALITEIRELFLNSGWQWFTFQQLSERLDCLRVAQPGLVEEFLESGGSLRALRRTLAGLLKDGFSIHDVATILEFLVDNPGEEGVNALRRQLRERAEHSLLLAEPFTKAAGCDEIAMEAPLGTMHNGENTDRRRRQVDERNTGEDLIR